MRRICFGIIFVLSGLFFLHAPVFAHVIVYPHQVGIAETQDFTVSVPNERNTAVVSVKLLMPNGLIDVLPNVTSGWTVTTRETGNSDSATVTQIDWHDGSIPVGQRSEFIFQAQVPPMPTTLDWKAYQTYADGTVVSWDVDPAKMNNLTDAQQDELADKENSGEYSTTQVINDLTASPTMPSNKSNLPQLSLVFSIVALILAAVSLGVIFRRKS